MIHDLFPGKGAAEAGDDAASDRERDRQRAYSITTWLFACLAVVEVGLGLAFYTQIHGSPVSGLFIVFVALLLASAYLNRRGFRVPSAMVGVITGATSYAVPCVMFGPSIGAEVWIVPMLAFPPLLTAPDEKRLLIAVYTVFGVTFVVTQSMVHMMPPQVRLDARDAELIRMANLAGVAVFSTGIIYIYRQIIRRAETRLARERERSERLLANILPRAISTRLSRDEHPIADQFEDVTVLFADVVGFTPFAASRRPAEVVNLLNEMFFAFDDMVERRGLEKIKTIGDAYMVAGGVPSGLTDHAAQVAGLAFEMLAFVAALSRDRPEPIRLRIGIHSGQVVAGVIGKRKFSYDLWGDTVNTAARLESSSEPGRVHVSEETRRRLGPAFPASDRGSVALKGLGSLRTYFLEATESAGALTRPAG